MKDQDGFDCKRLVSECESNPGAKFGLVLKNDKRRKKILRDLEELCGLSSAEIRQNKVNFANGSVIILTTMGDEFTLIKDLETVFYDVECGYTEAIISAVATSSDDELSKFLNSFKVLT